MQAVRVDIRFDAYDNESGNAKAKIMAKFQRKTAEERKDEIRRGAVQTFLKKGYRNTTMEDIVASTTLSKGGVYRYFKSTKEIMLSLMHEGNILSRERLRVLFDKAEENADVCALFSQALIEKLFAENPLKRLYLMFVTEIVYDAEFEKEWQKLNADFYPILRADFLEWKNEKPDLADAFLNLLEKLDLDFLGALVNALLMQYELFSDKRVLRSKKDFLYGIFYDYCKDRIK